MAGIGFELRKLINRDSYFSLVRAYAYAGLISSGPWVLSILGLVAIGLLSINVVVPSVLISQFQVSVTYLIMASLIFTGLVQLGFTRWVSDRLFARESEKVVPNFAGVLLVTNLVGGTLAVILVFTSFRGESVIYRTLMVAGFVTMCDIWVATTFMSGLKFYKVIVALFAGGYSLSVLLAMLLRGAGLEGLLAGYVVGQFMMLCGMVFIVLRSFPTPRLIAFDCFAPGAMYPSLVAVGLLYNFAIWADKIVFWLAPDTSNNVIGPLRASLIYDMPVFLAYLGIIPGMAVFLVRFETDFVEWYDKFYNAVRQGGSLEEIARMRDEMVFAIRQGLLDIVKIQTLSVLVMVVFAPAIFEKLHISTLYLPLFYVDAVAASLQVALLAVMNVFFYLDKRREVLAVVSLLAVLNVALSAVTLRLGAVFYGYGFALALLVTLVFALRVLERKIGRLEYETFMLQ
ncbi:exopolysaccharide Pel transporter PelG [Variovorax terrae]|uniref:Exopolysaccharide Pel transporter PelG n=1 Tax=Variovorax terrae TaxID=2923278 RepID=A0A9X2APZ4_9BURK|nr:exopolysaccharide Pel transporter PelG [Variovorax terrae]MCJ0765425.1 exopolysaccharide Pel transporter PelG [Variovorax terrae]